MVIKYIIESQGCEILIVLLILQSYIWSLSNEDRFGFHGIGFSMASGYRWYWVIDGIGFSVVFGFRWYLVIGGIGLSMVLGCQWYCVESCLC